MLGMFLLIQLSIVGGDWLRRSVLPALAMSMRSRVRDPSSASSGEVAGASCMDRIHIVGICSVQHSCWEIQ
jgi:hypothetical protein